MKWVFIVLISMAMSTAQAFTVRGSESICGLNASMQQEDNLLEEVLEQMKLECIEEGFEGVVLKEVSFSVVPHSWGTIGCTPISSLSVSGIKECF